MTKILLFAMLVLLLENAHIATAQCEVETRNHIECFEAQPVYTRGECIECVQNTIDSTVGTVTSCADYSRLICPSIQNECTACDGCERATEILLTCQFGAPDSFNCPFTCGFDKDSWEPTECSSESATYGQCFDAQGTSSDACTSCVQAGVNGIGQVRRCGQFSDILCPLVETGCPACDGCEKEAELLLTCNYRVDENSCPFFCGLPCSPRPTTAAPPIVCKVPSTTSSNSITFEAEDATNLMDSSLPACECCRITDNTGLLSLQQGYVSLESLADGTKAVTYFDKDDYLAFGPFDLGSGGNCATILLRYSRALQETASVLLHLDSPTGPFVGELLVTSTGGWGSYEVRETDISFSGEHTLFLVGQGGMGVMNLDWIQLTSGVMTTMATTEPASILTPAPVALTVSPTVPVIAPTATMTNMPTTAAPISPAPTMTTNIPTTAAPISPAPIMTTNMPTIAAPISPAPIMPEPTPEPVTPTTMVPTTDLPTGPTSSGHANKVLLVFTPTLLVCALFILSVV